jgi:hypothetical protein
LRPQPDETLIRRYLLGDLPESEANSLEQQYFTDGEVFEQVWAVENDLVDDYVAGRLASDDRARFERHYLASPRHRERVANARALRGAALGAGQPPARTSRPSSRPWAIPGPGWAVAAIVLLAVVAGWLSRSRPSDTRQAAGRPAETATMAPGVGPVAPVLPPPESPSAPRARPTATLTFALSPILVRGSSPSPELRISPGTEEILLRLEGDGSEAPVGRGRQLTATVRTVEGKPIWKGEARVASAAGPPNRLATVRLPATRVPPGDYILALSVADAPRREADLRKYYFRVVR